MTSGKYFNRGVIALDSPYIGYVIRETADKITDKGGSCLNVKQKRYYTLVIIMTSAIMTIISLPTIAFADPAHCDRTGYPSL